MLGHRSKNVLGRVRRAMEDEEEKSRQDNSTKGERIKRIAFLICGSIDSLTGGYIYDKKIVEYLRRVRGYQVDVLSVPLGSSRWFAIFANVWSALRLLRGRGGKNYDLVIEDGMIYRSVAIANSLLRRRAPLLGIVHMIDWRACKSSVAARISRVLEARMVSTLSCVVVNSKDTRAQVRSLLRPTSNNADDVASSSSSVVRLVYPGYETPDRWKGEVEALSDIKSEHLRILYAGQLIPRKGLHLLVEALSMLDYDDWMLYVAGDDRCARAYTQHVLELVDAYGLAGRVRMLGEVGRERMARLMASADLFVLPTMYEAFGISILEAQALGVPAVAFRVGGVKEVITDGVTGLLVEPFDVEELSCALERILCDPAYRRYLASSALRLKTREFPSWEECCERFAACVDQTLSLNEAKLD